MIKYNVEYNENSKYRKRIEGVLLMKSIFVKSLAALLTFIMILSSLASCAIGSENGGSSDFSDYESGEAGENANGTANGSTGNEVGGSSSSSNGSIVVYADGAYQSKVIRHELAGAFDKDVYAEVRSFLKSKVGSNPELETDFVPFGSNRYDGPAILVGSTDYPETAAVYRTLKDDQAKAVVSGNKYVIVWKNELAGLELVDQLKTAFSKKATKTNVTITSAWNLTVSIPSFDESGLKNTATLPNISDAGGSWAVSGRDGGHGSKIYIANNASSTIYTKYLSLLEKAGYTFYTKNESLHTNKFATYVTKDQIVSVMFFEPKKVIKVVVDPRSTFALPGLEQENIYTKSTAATEFVQLGMKQASGHPENGMGYIVKLTDGRFVVVDAGTTYDTGGGGSSANFVYDTMIKMQGNKNKPVIAAWIVTHIHTDHAGGFMGMANVHANDVVIEKLVYNQPSDTQMNAVSNMSGRKNWIPQAITKFRNTATNKSMSIVKAHPGMQLFFCDLTITILGSIDVIEDSSYTKMKNGNDSSVVSMFDISGVKFLLTGDCEPQEGKLIRDIYGGIKNTNSVLKADFIQIAHHGYGNTNTDYIGWDQNALNVMASGGVTGSGQSKTYALIPVGLANGKDPAGYYDAVQGMHALRIFDNDHRIVAYNKNFSVKVTPNGKYTMETAKHSSGFLIGTWTTY